MIQFNKHLWSIFWAGLGSGECMNRSLFTVQWRKIGRQREGSDKYELFLSLLALLLLLLLLIRTEDEGQEPREHGCHVEEHGPNPAEPL